MHLLPGLYQPADGSATCELSLQPDGSVLLRLWEGDSLQGPGRGLALLSRLVRDTSSPRLAGTWQSLPGSCCPGHGRLELEASGGDSFRVTLFTPGPASAAWPARPDTVFRMVAPLAKPPLHQALVGAWRLSLVYTSLLPGGQPCDPQEGVLTISQEDGRLSAQWQGWPGSLTVTPATGGLVLQYQDPAADFRLESTLNLEEGGLGLSGEFRSTTGEGVLRLVRRGLPADPPHSAASQQGELNGLWVDGRTGSDFMRISGTSREFSFESYGGERSRPRYLSQGRAQVAGPGRWQGRARDLAGYCCGNQGRLIFRRLDPDRLEVSAFWWPQKRPDPGVEPGDPYVLTRVKEAVPSQPAASGWPEAHPYQAELLNPQAGAVMVRFTPQASGQAGPATLFNQGGYGHLLELGLDGQGRLQGRLIDQQGQVIAARSQEPVGPGQPHQAWMVFQAGDKLRLWLDGQEVAQVAMPRPWAGSRAPYLLGGSRWPGRVFSGSLEQVELYASAQDPPAQQQPQLALTPRQGQAQPQAAPAPPTRKTLYRLWHPTRLHHAYTSDPGQVQQLSRQGYQLEGPIGMLWDQEVPGTKGLWAYQQGQEGYTLLSASDQAPEGFQPLGLLGYAYDQARDDTKPLLEMAAAFPEPLRDLRSQDRLYTTRQDMVALAQREGYKEPSTLAHLLPAQEPALRLPALYTWSGVWRGEGWGRFFLSRQGRVLNLFWYYSNPSGPHYFGRYRLSADGRSAKGVAVGQPGPQATYYDHQLRFGLDDPQGPRLLLTSRRLAAPLDDGRLVKFKEPATTTTTLIKVGQDLPKPDAQSLKDWAEQDQDPAALLRQALKQAASLGRLLQR